VIVYATTADLTSWLPDGTTIPTGADQLLRSAALLVAKAVNENLYDPAAVITEPKRDATCAQVAAWIAAGVTPGTGGLPAASDKTQVKAKKVGTAELQYDTSLTSSQAALAARAGLLDRLCPEAEAILQQAGVLWLPLATVTTDPVGPYGAFSRPMYGDGFGWGSWPCAPLSADYLP
jgi:hypothetical protein